MTANDLKAAAIGMHALAAFPLTEQEESATWQSIIKAELFSATLRKRRACEDTLRDAANLKCSG